MTSAFEPAHSSLRAHALGRRRPTGRRRFAAALVAATTVLASGLIALGSAPAAEADTAPVAGQPATVSADPLPTVQINGVAWDQVVVGNTVYVAGSFTFARPAGTPASSPSRVARANLLAYDLTTGLLVTGFNHALNGTARAVAASPDGTRLYVAGDFTTVDGIAHNRIAAFDLGTGALASDFTASLNNVGYTVTASNTAVYVGGSFTSANGSARTRLAGYSRAGALLPWNPGANALVRAMTLSPDGSRLIIGGGFVTLAGQPRIGIGAVFTDGTSAPWPADFIIKDSGSSSQIYSLTADSQFIYGTGYYFMGGGNFEGRFAVSPTGTLIWMNSCHGDSYDVAAIGPVLYSASHQHDCTDIGSFSQDNPNPITSSHHFLEAETTAATGQLQHPVFVGGGGQPGPSYADFAGQPSATALQWYPTLTIGSYTGQSQAAWSVAGNATYLSVGGEFPTANGTAQQGLVRYAIAAVAPNAIGPAAVTAPTPVSQSSGAVRVSWRAAQDQDNATLTYALLRDGGATPIYTTTSTGSFWKRPALGFTDAGLPPGSTHTYRVRVTDPLGNSVTSATSATVTVGSSAPPSYADLVRTDSASRLWRFAESSGSTAVDWAGPDDLTVRSAVIFGTPGPIPGNGTAATFDGSTYQTSDPSGLQGVPPITTTRSNSVAGAVGDALPNTTYSLEAWVRTSSTTGGLVVGNSLYAPTNGQPSPVVDRLLYFNSNGTVRLGSIKNGVKQTIGSPLAYNDGQWHHLVGTVGPGGSTLSVDGAQVAADAALTNDTGWVGHWRVGGDALTGWTPQPGSGYLSGSIADVAVYPAVLAADRIQAHYAAAGGPPANTPPTAAFTSTCTQLACSFDGSGSNDPGGSIVGYAWNFGDSTTGTGATPSHTYAAAGTYTVTLTVTDNGGATNSVSHPVTVATGSTAFAADVFGRTVASGWGTADIGGSWTVNPASRLSVAPGAGSMTLLAGRSDTAYLASTAVTSTDLTLDLALDKLPSTSAYLDVTGRRVATNREYDGMVRITSTGAIQLAIRKLDGSTTTVNVSSTVSGGTYTPGSRLNVRMQVQGTSPTTLRLKVWPNGTPEPAAWAVTTTDSSAALQAPGAVGVTSYLGSTDTNAPIVQTVRAFKAQPVG